MPWWGSLTMLLIAAAVGYFVTTIRHPPYREALHHSYDYIVVGAGSAGSVVASRLSEDAKSKVLLLEAGDADDNNLFIKIPLAMFKVQQTEADWRFMTEPQKHACFAMKEQRNPWPRGKVIGGTGSMNALAHVRGSRHDYDSWAAEGCSGWSYKDVFPYFLKSEDFKMEGDTGYHSVGGPITVVNPAKTTMADMYLKAGQELGYKIIDWNGKEMIGFSRIQATIKNGERCSSAQAFLKPAMQRENLHVSINSMVTKVIIKDKKAVGVEMIKNNKKRRIFARKEVILSAGTINSPHILMLSGIGPKEHLKQFGIPVQADLPVGENLQDHLVLPWFHTINDTVAITQNKASSILNILKYLFFGEGYLATMGMEGSAFLRADMSTASDKAPDIHILFHSISLDSGARELMNLNLKMEAEESMFDEKYEGKESFVVSPILSHPKSRGTITLRSVDPFDHPVIDPRYLEHPDDVKMMVTAMRMAERVTNTSIMQKIGTSQNSVFRGQEICKQHAFRSDEFWECFIRHFASTSYHATSTCRMGAENDPTAVVDPELRVKGIKGLRVVDCSVMRNVPSGNTNAPVIMIAEKAADMIQNIDSVSKFRARLKNLV